MQSIAVGDFRSTGGGVGVVRAGLVRVREIRIGSAIIRSQAAKVVPLRESSNDRGPRPPRAGILGLELFERFAVQLHRASKTVTLKPLETFVAAPESVSLPIRFNEDAPLTAGTFNGVAGDFEKRVFFA